MLRRFVYAFTLTCLNNGFYQLLINATFSLIIMIWTLVLRPFNSFKSNLLTVINEIAVLICFVTSMGFLVNGLSDQETNKISNTFMLTVVTCMGINIVFTLISILISAYQSLKSIIMSIHNCLNRKNQQQKFQSVANSSE